MWQQFEHQSQSDDQEIQFIPRVNKKILYAQSNNLDHQFDAKDENENIVDYIEHFCSRIDGDQRIDEAEHNQNAIAHFECLSFDEFLEFKEIVDVRSELHPSAPVWEKRRQHGSLLLQNLT